MTGVQTCALPIFPIMDFDRLASSVRSRESILRGPLTLKDGIVDVADVMQDIFKVGTLLRLGYTMRNAVDSQLRTAANFGVFTNLKFLKQGLSNFITNSKAMGPRLVDNMKMLRYGETRSMRVRRLSNESNSLSKQIKEFDDKIKKQEDVLNQLEAGPTIPDFKSKQFDGKQMIAIKNGKMPESLFKKDYLDNVQAEGNRLWEDVYVSPVQENVDAINKLVAGSNLAGLLNRGEFP